MAHPSFAQLVEDDPWMRSRLVAEKDPANLIVVQPIIQHPHPALSSTASAIGAKRRSIRKGASVAYSSRNDLEFSRRSGWLIASIGSAERALRLMDALLKACISRGLEVFLEQGEILVALEGHSVRVRITERLQRKIGPTAGLSLFQIRANRHIVFSPTSELIIAVRRLSDERRTTDKPGEPLERQLNTVMANIFRGIAETKAWREYIQKSMAEYNAASEARAAALEVKRLLAEESERLESERRQRVARLVTDANGWQQSKTILAYVDHVAALVNQAGAPVSAELRAWIEWATDTAKSMDPTSARVNLMGGIGQIPPID